MMTLYGVVGWSMTAPDLIIVVGVAIGVGAGLLPARTLRQPTASKTRVGSLSS
jgi:hypothetical protein